MHHETSTNPVREADRSHDRAVGRWLFVSCACFYLLCTSGHIFTPDGAIMFRVMASVEGGGVCWGPRFLIPAIPLLVVPIASLLTTTRRDLQVASSCVLVVSAAIAFSGTVVNYFEYANWLKWQVMTDASFAAQGITSAYQLFLLLSATHGSSPIGHFAVGLLLCLRRHGSARGRAP